MAFRRETRSDDDARTGRLLDHVDRGLDNEPSSAFSAALLDGLVSDKAAEAAGHYPPAGHGYPRKG